ncbi:hypothetical protein JHK82_043795 [Glycine max]|uniref:Uncharacterized protein n=1 Tax=Glycine soja TaxID=3848 RepID=A0A0B2R7G2_GLYSO|nr:hypothetical protein JHK85_044340 [Glycine max]KAG5106825.1 hypothetical protein JHK82_043795 [Glycine max]KAG5117750.1 hypothetical protein JHK84_043863 [Glycine max]KHN27722.1 hypothetical protein glysoja_025527 [Glycine soja]
MSISTNLMLTVKDINQILKDNTKNLKNLTVLNFDKCEFLRQIPDVSNLPNLEELSFEYCENLITFHNSIGVLNKLQILSAEGCWKLRLDLS